MKLRVTAILCVLVLGAGVSARAADPARKGPVRVEASESGATEKGEIEGEQVIEYVFSAQTGQALSIVLEANSKNAHFDLIGPGSETPIYISAITGDRYTANVRASGDHIARVYLVRRAARKGESASYSITFRLTAATAQ